LPGGKEASFTFLNHLKLIDISNNLGDAKSLICHPYTTTHSSLNADQKHELGISEGHIRLSVGLEHPDDLIGDLMAAYARLSA